MSIIFTEIISGDLVTLRNPDLRNSVNLTGGINVSRTMNNKLRTSIITKKVGKKFEMSFSDIKNSDKDNLVTFMLNHNGKEITMTDTDGTIYTGYLLTDPIDISKTSSINEANCTDTYYTNFSLTFEQK